MTIETSIQLSPEMDGTRLEWSSQVTELGGLIKAVSRSLIEGAAAQDRQRLVGHVPRSSGSNAAIGFSIVSPFVDCSPEQYGLADLHFRLWVSADPVSETNTRVRVV